MKNYGNSQLHSAKNIHFPHFTAHNRPLHLQPGNDKLDNSIATLTFISYNCKQKKTR